MFLYIGSPVTLCCIAKPSPFHCAKYDSHTFCSTGGGGVGGRGGGGGRGAGGGAKRYKREEGGQGEEEQEGEERENYLISDPAPNFA